MLTIQTQQDGEAHVDFQTQIEVRRSLSLHVGTIRKLGDASSPKVFKQKNSWK